jgi:hypothetical protein
VVNYGSGTGAKAIEKLASLLPGEKALLPPPDSSALQSVTVTADHGVSITKAYRTPINMIITHNITMILVHAVLESHDLNKFTILIIHLHNSKSFQK